MKSTTKCKICGESEHSKGQTHEFMNPTTLREEFLRHEELMSDSNRERIANWWLSKLSERDSLVLKEIDRFFTFGDPDLIGARQAEELKGNILSALNKESQTNG